MPAISVRELLVLLTILVFGGIGSLFWIWMLVDCLRSTRLENAVRIRWAVVIAVTHWLGAGIYYLWGKRGVSSGLSRPEQATEP